MLQSLERVAEPHDRQIPEPVQQTVYERDRSTCRLCGWNMDRWRPNDPRILELHHVLAHAERGANDPSNLVVLCSTCHDNLHADRVSLPSEFQAGDG